MVHRVSHCFLFLLCVSFGIAFVIVSTTIIIGVYDSLFRDVRFLEASRSIGAHLAYTAEERTAATRRKAAARAQLIQQYTK